MFSGNFPVNKPGCGLFCLGWQNWGKMRGPPVFFVQKMDLKR